jgi:hypothetical protein
MTTGKILFPIKKGLDAVPRLSMILWGLSSVGKTTFAATAPGEKLLIAFGSEEHASVIHRKDLGMIDMFSRTQEEVFLHGVGNNPFGLDHLLYDNKAIKTVIVDSLTPLQQLGLEKAVFDGVGKSKNFSPTMQNPGRPAWGGRNQNLIAIAKALLRVTAKHNVHIVFTSHEDDPVTRVDQNGVETIEKIRISLGGKLLNIMTSQVSEIWNMRHEPGGARNRIVTFRSSGYRTPMKTRMFSQQGEASFIWSYDPDRPDTDKDQMTIAKFYDQWIKGGMRRIAAPQNRRGGDSKDNVEQRHKPKDDA